MNTIQQNKCTGERYKGELLSNLSFENWHGKFGHFNLFKLDHDSWVTGKGQHDRVMATSPENNEVYCRVDHIWGLGMPSERQIIEVMRKDQGIKGKWKISKIEPWDCGEHTDVYLEKI